MISNSKLVEYVNLAKESNHPEPEKAVIGRANQSGLDSEFSKDGKIGLFGVSQRKASELGFSKDDLLNPDDNFKAMMALDGQGYGTASNRESDDPLLDMYAYTSGVSGGKEPKAKYNQFIQDSFDEMAGANGSNLIYDDGKLVDIQNSAAEDVVMIDESAGNIDNQIRYISSTIQDNITNITISGDEMGMQDQLRQVLQLSYEVALENTKKYKRQ